jgi:tRNA-splicing ligase RtcB
MTNRTDPYQTRARELCIAAGIEPDSRVGEGRGQPAWCTFRDTARAEHVAAEQAVVAADLAANAIAPQALEYR